MATNIANASIAITPTFNGLQKQIQQALQSTGITNATNSAGTSIGGAFSSSMSSGIVKSGAIAGAIASVTNKAISTISSSMSAAISRFDTLNNYPSVMQTLGYETEIVNASLATMDERLQGLPTSLDSMVSLVQGLTATTGDLELATDAGLALNDMLIASGSSTQLTASAMEQFRQILAKGKPEMQDWRSLTNAMPGQMQQLAEAMLGAGANANDLYAALGGGGEEATITTTELLNAMIKLDQEGGDGITAFAEQAKTASGGVATSMANLQTAINRGLAGTLDAIGKDTITETFTTLRDTINEVFSSVNGAIEEAMPIIKNKVLPAVKSALDVVIDFAPAIVTTTAAMKIATSVVPKVTTAYATFTKGIADAGIKAKSFGAAMAALNLNPVVLGITAVVAAISIGVTAFEDWKKNTENAEKATKGLSEAVKRTASLDSYSGKIEDIGTKAQTTRTNINDLNESIAGHVDAMNDIAEEAETEIATLNTVQGIINSSIGVTDLSAEAQGRLTWALSKVNEQFDLHLSKEDVLNGYYQDQEGNVKSLKDEILKLVDAKKQEIKMNALQQQYDEAYAAQAEAKAAYASAYNDYQATYDAIYEQKLHSGYSEAEARQAAAESRDNILAKEGYTADLESATQTLRTLESAIYDTEVATSEAADAVDAWGITWEDTCVKSSAILTSKLGDGGLAMLKEDLRTLGADTEALGKIDDDTFTRIVDVYDGTASSIVDILAELGVEMDDAAKDNAKRAKEIADAITDMGADLGDIDLSAFSQKLSDAGVSTEELNEIGSENLGALAEACGYDMDLMVWYLGNYNNTPILDKDGHVQVDEAELLDAQGNVYTWNGTGLFDKNSNAIVDNVSLTDAQGNLWTWNGSTLEPQDGTAHVEQDQLVDGLGNISSWNSSSLKPQTGYVNVITNVINTAKGFLFGNNAAGGIRLNAAGGYRFHANGAIATKAVPLDIVGEDGAEAIVPLTNKRYSLPFADIIAELVAKRQEKQSKDGSQSIYINNLTVQAQDAKSADAFVTMLRRAANAYA